MTVTTTTFNQPADELPPLTRRIRQVWSAHTPHPVASAEAIGEIFEAVAELERRVIDLETN